MRFKREISTKIQKPVSQFPALILTGARQTGKRVVKSTKIFFNEMKMLSLLLGIKPDNFTDSPSLGGLWEGFIYSELRKLQKNLERQSYLWFYRDNRNRDTKNLHSVYNDLQTNSKNLPFKLGKLSLLF